MSGQGSPIVAPNQSPGAPRVQFVEDFYVYQVDIPAIPVGGTLNANFQVQADSDFKLIKMTYQSEAVGAVTGFPLVSLQIQDSGSGRNLFSLPVPVGAIFGDGTLPFILPIPRIFKARSNVTIVANNYDAAIVTTLHLSFIGTKIFQLGQ